MTRNWARIRQLTIAVSISLIALPAMATTRTTSASHGTKSSHATGASKSHSSKSQTAKSSVKRTSSKSKKSKTTKNAGWRTRQAVIDSNRAREIQAALIQAHYLDGAPTGSWDARSKAAMQKFQGDNGWQTKRIPDARALIKLGLGPDHADLINPNTAFISQPQVLKGGGISQNP